MLVGITGRAQHGKDTVAQVLVQYFGFVRVGFADALKELAYATNPYIPGIATLQTVVDEMGWEEAKRYPEVRRFLQVLGTKARDILGSDVWIDAAERKMIAAAPNPVVFSDVRFPNEADFIHRWHGVLLRVTRPGFDNGVDPLHPSELFVPDLPAAADIINDGTVEELRGQAMAFGRLVGEGR